MISHLLGDLAVVRLCGAQDLPLAAYHDAVVREGHGETLGHAVVLLAELAGKLVGDLRLGLARGVLDGEALEHGRAHGLLVDIVGPGCARVEEVNGEGVLGVQELGHVEGRADLGFGFN